LTDCHPQPASLKGRIFPQAAHIQGFFCDGKQTSERVLMGG
jgi:hypothetical protein